MQVVHGLGGLRRDVGPSCATIGVFDGVHTGHQVLIRKVVEEARRRGATSVVVTFDRHPLEIIAPGKEPPLITTLRQRAEVLEALGIEVLLVLRFDDALRRLEPEDFVRHVLVGGLGVVHLVVGSNFRFGHNHAGTVQTLAELGPVCGFTVDIFSLLGGEQALSSSLIRRQLSEGQVEAVAQELGRPFRLEGHVEPGAGRGRRLGVPTANVRVPEKVILPKIGVYAGWLWWRGDRYPAVISVGLNPTFEERDRPVVEAHALGFDADIRGEVVSVEFTHRLRDELKFPDADSLVEQIRDDIARARELLGVG